MPSRSSAPARAVAPGPTPEPAAPGPGAATPPASRTAARPGASTSTSTSGRRAGRRARPAAEADETPVPAGPTQPRLVAPEGVGDDTRAEARLRPARLAEFLGQAEVRESLEIAITAARARGEPLDHVLFHGPPGLGKTTLASLMAFELGTNAHFTSGPVLERPGDLVGILTTLARGDILFIDEIHRLRPVLEEFLYPAMEDQRLDVRLGDGPGARVVSMPLEPFTLVGATTRLGLLTAPMRARFGLVERLVYYTVPELTTIVERSARLLGLAVTPEGAAALAARARGTPRIANRLLRRVRDWVEVRAPGPVTPETVEAALGRLGVGAGGLDAMDLRVLRVLATRFGGGPVGLASLGAAVGESAETIEETMEPYLVQEGYLERTSRGRVLGQRAWAELGLPVPPGWGGALLPAS